MIKLVCSLANARHFVVTACVIGAVTLQYYYISKSQLIHGAIDPLLEIIMPSLQLIGSFLLGLIVRAIIRAARKSVNDKTLRKLLLGIPLWYLLAAIISGVIAASHISGLNAESSLSDLNTILSANSFVISSVGIVFISLPAGCVDRETP